MTPSAPRATHEQIAEAIADPGEAWYPPTPEQRGIIEAPLAPALVVAGAGSGKTHTMMLRILWLIANEGLEPREILGLTFTRKAAGELRERVERALHRLRERRLVEFDEFNLPEVSTYNSFANTVYSQYALLVGREPDAVLLDEPGAIALMREVVIDTDLPLAGDDRRSITKTVESALGIARQLRENQLTGADAIDFVDRFESGWQAIPGTRTPKGVVQALESVSALRSTARLADEFERRKRERGYIEFSDQVAEAAEIVRRDPSIAAELRAQWRTVILDEYQDTSVAQTDLFSTLFRGHPVMAVGDPKQSIYGWRGASAANMQRFARDFGATAPPYELTVSWRNDVRILEAANAVAAALPEAAGAAELVPRPGADVGAVEARWLLADTDEASAIAEWLHERFVADPRGARRSGAVLVRRRSQMGLIADALEARGVPHRVLGLGGLLGRPEIVDLNAMLRVAADEHAGGELIRLLVGARTELGLADVAGLHRLGEWLARRDAELGEIDPALRLAMRDRPQADAEIASLVDALDHLRTTDPERLDWLGMSDSGLHRARALAESLHRVRTLLHLPLVDLVDAAIRISQVDLEAIANPRGTVGRANLDAYLDAVRAYAAANADAGLDEFLDWLELSESDDRLEEVVEEQEQAGVVQLTTMHSAKGLEWDVVVVPQLTGGIVPYIDREKGWVGKDQMPYPLRKDRDDLPRLAWEGWDDFKDFKVEFVADRVVHDPDTGLGRDSYVTQERARQTDEYRRLAYVAVTRARHELLLTSSRWRGRNSTPTWPSEFLHEMVGDLELEVPPGGEAYALIDGAPVRSTLEVVRSKDAKREINDALGDNPNDIDEHVAWPRPPMPADRLARTAALAERIAAAADGEPEPNRYDEVIDLLLAERDERRRTRELELPERFGASYFSDLLADPVRTARAAARPMPQEPFRATLLGNLFHAWVEGLFTDVAAGATWLDGLEPGDAELADTGLARASADDRAKLELCQANFLRSRFAPDRIRPVAVELPIESPLGGATVVGKLDAVYEHGPAAPDDPGAIEIVDWKTGRPPRDAAERAGRELQLMLYAHAYSAGYDVPLERIRATLYYVADDLEITLERIPPLAELEARLDAAREQARAGG